MTEPEWHHWLAMGFPDAPKPAKPRHVPIHDDDPVWVDWRTELEDVRSVYNVDTRHPCWTSPETIRTVDSARQVHGCTVCGRLHQCDPETIVCTSVPSISGGGAHVCAFSGRELRAADPDLGTYQLEVDARQAAVLNQATTPFFEGKKEAARYAAIGNRLTGSQRNHQFTLRDSAKALGKSAIVVSQYNRKMAHQDADDDDLHSDAVFVETPVVDPAEETRDTGYLQRYFQPLEEELAFLQPMFAPAQPEKKPSPAAALNVSTGIPVPRKGRPVFEVRVRLRTALQHMIAVLDALVPETPCPPADARLTYYESVTANAIELATGKSLHQLQDSELQRHLAVLLLDVLATTMRDRDGTGASLVLWTADPWLQWCKGHEVAQSLIHFGDWSTTSSKPYLARTNSNPSRKRKRSGAVVDTTVTRTCPVSPEALQRLRELPESIRNALIQSARNISHQGNSVRNAIYDRHMRPLTVFTLVHRTLLEDDATKGTIIYESQ